MSDNNTAGAMPVILFLERSCGACRRLAVELDRAGVSYELRWISGAVDCHTNGGDDYLRRLVDAGYTSVLESPGQASAATANRIVQAGR